MKSTTIQFTRGAIQYNQMTRYIVPVLDFPFGTALDSLFDMRLQLNREANRAEFEYPKMLRTTLLQDLLRFFVPTIAHPFILNYDELVETLPRSGKPMYMMPALGIPRLTTDKNAHEVPCSDKLLKQIVVFWLEQVVPRHYFQEDEMEQRRVQRAFEEAKELVEKTKIVWRFNTVADLWGKRLKQSIGYRAVQTLLAVQFVENARRGSKDTADEYPGWRLAQEGTHLIPVSNVQQDEKKGTFYAFTIEIELRDMPGYETPRVYLTPRLRRYMAKDTTPGDDAMRVMVELPTPLKEQLPPVSLTVQVALRMPKRPPEWEHVYAGGIVEMLQILRGQGKNAIIIPEKKLLANPEKYMKPHPDWHQGRYFLIYNTGMSPKPDMGPGLPDTQLQQIHLAVRTHLEEWVQMEAPHVVDETLLLSDDIIHKKDWLSLMSLKTIKDKKNIWISSGTLAQKREGWPDAIQKQFRLALKKKRLKVILIADKDTALDAMEKYVRSTLAVISMEETLPAGFQTLRVKTPSILVAPAFVDNKKKAEETKKDAQAIHRWLMSQKELLPGEDEATVALIQRPNAPSDWYERSQDDAKKQAVRIAFSRASIRTQMIRRFPDDEKKGLQNSSYFASEQRSRLINAVSDMLIAGTGMVYGSPAQMYQELLNFEADFAQQIVVEYWVRYRIRKFGIDYIAVARQYADSGYIEVIFPDPKTGQPLKPLSVHEAYLYAQRLFFEGKKSARQYTPYASSHQVNRASVFFEAHLTHREQPTLIVPQVGDWRSGKTPWFKDDYFADNPQSVAVGNRTYTSEDLSGVRVVKMLKDERFNMRYWLHDDRPEHEKGLLFVPDAICDMPTAYSVDTSTTSDTDIASLDADYKRGRVLEFTSVLMQPEDTGQIKSWCAIPHLARIHPGWSRAKTVYPYPYHLVTKIIDDARWTILKDNSE